LWIFVPIVFFQIWPTKGYQYLLAIAPPFALLASRTLMRWLWIETPAFGNKRLSTTWVRALVGGILIVTLLSASWQTIQPATSGAFVAGTGGVPGGREAGEWIQKNIPAQATLLTIGPSMANILQFYGQRKALGISISPNPLHRNPASSLSVIPTLKFAQIISNMWSGIHILPVVPVSSPKDS
jgi:hypothetical protein